MPDEATGNVSLVLNYTEFKLNYFVIERPWVVHTGAGLTYLVIIMNLFVIYLFLKTENISPSTIVLAALAMSDGLSAMGAFLPKHFGYLFNQIETTDLFFSEGMPYIDTKYPFCILYAWTFITMSVCFHNVSVILTVLLSGLKAASLAFPVWCKVYITKRVVVVSIVITSIFIIALSIPIGLVYNFTQENDDHCTFTSNKVAAEFFGKVYPKLVAVLYIVSLGVLLFSTIYICAKLTCLRQHDKFIVTTTAMNDKFRRISFIVVLLSVNFVIFDSLFIVCIFHLTVTHFEDLSFCAHDYWQYNGLLTVVGFATNYVIYLSVSQRIRHQIFSYFQHASLKLKCRFYSK